MVGALLELRLKRQPASKLKIERGIPVPELRPNDSRLLRSMKVGESVLFPPERKHSTVQMLARRALGKGKYATRRTEGGTRVWRIK